MMSQTRIHKHDNHRVDEALPSSLDPRKATDQGLFGLWQVQYPCWLDGSHEPVRYAQATRFLPRSRIFQTREMDGGIQGEPSQVLLLSIWRRPRSCIGEPFAWMEMILVLATIAQRWQLRHVPSHRVELLPRITLRPKYGMEMILEKRGKTG